MFLYRQFVSQVLIVSVFFAGMPAAIPVWGEGQKEKRSPAVSVAPKIATPQDGLTVKQGVNVDVLVVAPNEANVSSVAVLGDDGNALGISNQSPFVIHWNTEHAKAGLRTLKAQVYYKDGTATESLVVHVMVEPGAPVAPATTSITLKEATSLILTNEEKLVSGDTPEGSVVRFRVERDVLAPGGQVLIRAGSTAYGKAVKSSGSGMFGTAGELNLTIESVDAVDGTSVPVRTDRNAEAEGSLGGVIVGALLLSWLFVFMSGDDVEIEPGTIFTAYVNRDTVIERPGPAQPNLADDGSRTVSLLVPSEGATIQKEDKILLNCITNPVDNNAFVRIYLDKNNLLVAQKGNLDKIEWDTNRTERYSSGGKHTLTAEVTFSTGHIVTTKPVTFSLQD